MTVEELLARCELVRASEKRLAECQPFSCGENDLDEFFAKDCLINQSRLLGKTYLFCLKEQIDTVYRINKRRTMMEYNARLEFKANGTWKKVQ